MPRYVAFIDAVENFIYSYGNEIIEIPISDLLGIRNAKSTLGSYIVILFLVVGVPYIIGQVIYEQ